MSQTDLCSSPPDLSSGPDSQTLQAVASPAELAAELRRQLHHHAHRYYVLDAPENEAVLAGVRENVTKQCRQFTVYG